MTRDPHTAVGPYLQADIRDEHAHDTGRRETPDPIDLAIIADTWRRQASNAGAHHRAHGTWGHQYHAAQLRRDILQHLTADDHITAAGLVILTSQAERAHYPRPHWF